MLEAARAERWRLRAVEVRQAAAIMDDPKIRATLQRVATTYEELARRAGEVAPGRAGTARPTAALPRHAVTV